MLKGLQIALSAPQESMDLAMGLIAKYVPQDGSQINQEALHRANSVPKEHTAQRKCGIGAVSSAHLDSSRIRTPLSCTRLPITRARSALTARTWIRV